MKVFIVCVKKKIFLFCLITQGPSRCTFSLFTSFIRGFFQRSFVDFGNTRFYMSEDSTGALKP